MSSLKPNSLVAGQRRPLPRADCVRIAPGPSETTSLAKGLPPNPHRHAPYSRFIPPGPIAIPDHGTLQNAPEVSARLSQHPPAAHPRRAKRTQSHFRTLPTAPLSGIRWLPCWDLYKIGGTVARYEPCAWPGPAGDERRQRPDSISDRLFPKRIACQLPQLRGAGFVLGFARRRRVSKPSDSSQPGDGRTCAMIDFVRGMSAAGNSASPTLETL